MPRPDLTDSAFLAACRSERHDRIPVWFMRQAGRSLPEYRAIRGEGSILNAIAKPDLATEITLQPVRRYGTDAAILYSDIVTPVHAIGFGVDIAPGVGPVVEQPFRSAADLDRLRPLDPETDTPYVLETVRNLVAELPVPLIAFAGAPFTVASYLIEGRPSRTYALVKSLMLTDEPLWFQLMDRLADLAIASVRSQVDAGASAIQLFDSWAGALSPAQYERYVQPASRKVFDSVRDLDVPLIHFGVHTGELLGLMADAGADVMGVDWRTPLDDARTRVPARCALQGNLDPTTVLAGWEPTRDAVADILRRNAGHPGHVFNLGHGVLPETDPAVLEQLVGWLHEQPGGAVDVSDLAAPRAAGPVGVVVMAYGTPSSVAEIESYYTHIRRGRAPEPQQLADLTARYEAIGGISPLAARTESQRVAIAAALDEREPGGFIVGLGQKHAAPYIEDGVAALVAAGAASIVGLVLAPHFSRFSVGQYHERAAATAAELGVPFRGIDHWHDLPEFIAHQSAALRSTLATMPERTKVVFTAHSLPERVLVNDPYPDQLFASASAIAAQAGLGRWAGWGVAWQSAGRTPEPWRGPDILSVIDDLAATGRSDGIVIVPQGFTSDHLEVLYDVDIEAKRRAESVGLTLGRPEVVNADPLVMAALAARVASVVP